MGALTSRQNAGVEEADVVSNHAYKYPPRSGKWNFSCDYLFILSCCLPSTNPTNLNANSDSKLRSQFSSFKLFS